MIKVLENPKTNNYYQLKKFVLTWAPWNSNTDPMSDYGETWCEFTFTARDSQDLVSQTTTVVLGKHNCLLLEGSNVSIKEVVGIDMC